MVGLRHVATVVARDGMPLATVTDLLLSASGQLYTIGRSESGIGVFDVSGSGLPVFAGQTAYRGAGPLAGLAPMAIVLPSVGSGALLLPAGLNNAASSTYRLTADGLPGTAVRWQSGATLPADMALVHGLEGMPTPGFIGVRSDGSLVPFTLDDGARLAARFPETGVTQVGGGVAALETLRIGDSTFLVTASAQGQSVVSYKVLHDLRLERTAWVDGQASGIGFSQPAALRTVVLGDAAYVILAASGSSSLSVFRLAADGRLVATDHIVDSRDTRFQSVTVLETLTLGGQVFVLAAGADDGLSLLTLLPGGRLIHLASLADSMDMTLGAISALAAGQAAGGGEVFVASARDPGLTRLALDFVPGLVRTEAGRAGGGTLTGTAQDDLLMAVPGITLVQGGLGNDILMSAAGSGDPVRLQGGAGKDLFVIQPGARRTILTDFTPDTDRIDLTLLPMLRSLAQIGITSTSGGAILRFGQTEIEVLTANGRSLSASDFSDASLLPVSRFAPTPLAPQGVRITLGQGGGQASGTGGNDTLMGGAGHDTLRGLEGDDRIEGGAGNDNIGGGPGNDLILVLSGANMIWGGLGDDTIEGGSGPDTIDGGGNGRNRLLGHDGNDWIYAGSGGDFIGGGAGNDVIRGGTGSDTIHGGLGNDNIGGGGGDDLIYGSAGRNVIWGGLGHDTIHGAGGSDTLYGGPGRNQLFGHGGDDWIFAGSDGDLIGGGDGHDTLRGGDGADSIYGGFGNDNIGGGAGADVLYGSAGQNLIWGGLGNDTVHAGTGRDILNGGPGADVFVFASAAHIGIGAGRDVIADFQSGSDTLDLRALATTFNGTAGLLGGGQASFYSFAPGGLLIGDQTGNGTADWVLELTGAPGVAAADFLL